MATPVSPRAGDPRGQTPTKSVDILSVLCAHQVEFIVVGMTAAVLQGAPAVTFDLGLVYARNPTNIARLLAESGAGT